MRNKRLVICPVCGKERLVYGERIKSDGRCRSCFQLRERNPQWKGGRIRTPQGYIMIRLEKTSPFYGMAKNTSYVCEHRLIMAQKLNRPLLKGEKVHHSNGIRDDNRLENLELISQGNHLLYEEMCGNCPLRREIRTLRRAIQELKGNPLPGWGDINE